MASSTSHPCSLGSRRKYTHPSPGHRHRDGKGEAGSDMPLLRDLGGRGLCSQTMSLDMDREKEPAVLGEGGKQKGDDPLTSWPAGPAVPSPTGPCREQSHRQGCTGSVSVSRRRTGTGKKALACR